MLYSLIHWSRTNRRSIETFFTSARITGVETNRDFLLLIDLIYKMVKNQLRFF